MIKKLVHADSPFTLDPTDKYFEITENQEIRLECDTTAGVIVINLPDASAYPFINPKVIVTDIAGTAATHSITVNAGTTAPDTFNGVAGAGVQVISQNGGSARFEITSLDTATGVGNYIVTAGNPQAGPLKVVTTTGAAYAADGTEDIILVDSSANAVTVTLALASRAVKQTIIKDKSANAKTKNITIAAHAGDTLDVAGLITIDSGSVGYFNGGPGSTVDYQFAPNMV